MKKETFKALQGKRLKECLDRCHLSQAEFCRKANYSTTSLNEIVKANGKRGVPDYLIAEWSEILGVDAGYFVARDHIASYEDFKGWDFAKSEWINKADFLKYANCKIINMQMVDNKRIESYYIYNSDTKKSADISAKKMKDIESRITDYIKFIIQEAMKEGDQLD